MEHDDIVPLISTIVDSDTLLTTDDHKHTIDGTVLTWSHIHVQCRQSKRKPPRILLDNLSGIARPGQVLAIMGTSGVGKTTLLKVLSGQDDPRTTVTNGDVLLDGRITTRSARLSSSLIGLVEQNELFMETMSLEEHMIFQVFPCSFLVVLFISFILHRPC
jgi:ABC-type bacteriocin/lantibiotic exporter with double-glycine peptidase domain